MERRCIECGRPIAGRSDKKYCSDQCRTAHYNRLNREAGNVILETNKVLMRNYKILREIVETCKGRCGIVDLVMRGYDFDVFTGIVSYGKKGLPAACCYDCSYSVDSGGNVIVMRVNLR